ncbi:endonuclease protein, partial [Trichomonas vaginalis G3]|uniref:endonuclease protein n=1 Tax=Trichomonas vaginalis (strain ATCC PRA-98 / G3) TaxID=412133 RepID=UPI0021E5BE31
MTYLPNEDDSIKVEITTSTDNINLKLAGDKVGTKTNIHSIKSDGKNKIAHQIPFAICFNNREDKVEKLFIKIKFAELIFEKQITVIPCYIRFTKTAINGSNPKINFDFDVPQRSPAPICNGKYYIFDSQKFLEIDNHTKMKEEDSYHVVTPFSYNVYSLNEPNQYTTIHYNENHQIQYQKNVLNFSYFVIDRNGKYYVVHKNDLKEDHQIVCGRLCQSDIRTTGKDKAQKKWQNCWFPFTDDKEAIKQLFSNHQKNIYHMIYMTKSILEFIRLPYDESLAAKNILNYIVDIFYHRLEALNKQKGHLRTDVDIKLIFETRKSCQIDIPLNPINEILNTTDELFKRDLQRIVNGFTPERRNSFIRVMSEILKDSPVYSKQDKTEKDYQYLLQNVFKYSPLNILMKKVLDFIKSKSLIISVDDEKTNVVDSIITKYKGAPVKNNSEFNSLIEREI